MKQHTQKNVQRNCIHSHLCLLLSLILFLLQFFYSIHTLLILFLFDFPLVLKQFSLQQLLFVYSFFCSYFLLSQSCVCARRKVQLKSKFSIQKWNQTQLKIYREDNNKWYCWCSLSHSRSKYMANKREYLNLQWYISFQYHVLCMRILNFNS